MSSAQSNQETPKPNGWVACKDCGALRPVQTLRAKGCDECVTAGRRKASKPHALNWEDVQADRDERVRQSDWIEGAYVRARIGAEAHDKWLEYRAQLFDITKNFSSPDVVKWPTPPTKEK